MNNALASASQSSSARLAALETKKLALVSLMKVARTITHLLNSMDEVKRLSQQTFQLPPAMMKFYQCMYGKFKHDPTGIIEANLSEIESRIRMDMSTIIDITNLDDSEFEQYVEQAGDSSSGHKMTEMLKIFRRRAKTAISLRLILKERGVLHKPLILGIPESTIMASIDSLAKKEKSCIGKVKENIEEFVKSIDIISMDKQAGNKVHDYLKSIRKGLIINLTHLNAGKSIMEIPFPFEKVEIENDEPEIVELPDHVLSALSSSDEAQHTKGYDVPKISEIVVRKGFFASLWQWLNSPMNVGWNDKNKD